MHARPLLFAAALAAIAASGAYHWHATRTRADLELEREHLGLEAAKKQRLHDQEKRQIADARSELEVILAKRASRPASSANSAGTPAANNTPPPPPKPAASTPNPELRQLQVQAHVSDQRLRFGALLGRLGFTAENLQAFDQTHRAFQQAMLDEAQTPAGRQAARELRDTQLKELFGANYEQWTDANRNEPARTIVNQIVQMTFQSSGALTTAQADKLAEIVAQHRLPSVNQPGASQQRYDWDRIIADAESILAERQRKDFIVVIENRRASDQMSAMAAKKN